MAKLSDSKYCCPQQMLYCFGTEGRSFKSAIRVCVVENIVPFLFLWLILLIVFTSLIFSSEITVMTQNRRFDPIPYSGYNETGPYEFDNDELIWFLQISDIHLSKNVPKVYKRFEDFLRVNIPAINPKFVFATGDLADQMEELGYLNPITPSKIEPNQWHMYHDLLQKNLGEKFNPDFWIDFRGNHDNYEVPSITSKDNLFVNYSVSALRPDPYARVINYTYRTKKNSTYSFVAFDACPPVGLSAPMNFYGLITEDILSQLKQQVQVTRHDNHTILMGHYPLSTMNIYNHPLKNGRKMLEEQILSEWRPTAYLSGHLHLSHLYDSNNFMLDLELADFMLKSAYRLLAFDNDIFSFVDTKLYKWPLVLVTNPKNSKHLSQKDKWQRMARSTHIRALIFSPWEINSIRVYVDDELISSVQNGSSILGTYRTNGDGLYEFPWNVTEYDDGRKHSFRMEVIDARNNKHHEHHHFHLGGRAKQLGSLYSHIILTINTQAFFLFILMTFYTYTLFMCLLIPKFILCVLRSVDHKYYRAYRTRIKAFLHEWCGTMEVAQDIAEKEHMPVITSIAKTPSAIQAKHVNYGTVTDTEEKSETPVISPFYSPCSDSGSSINGSPSDLTISTSADRPLYAQRRVEPSEVVHTDEERSEQHSLLDSRMVTPMTLEPPPLTLYSKWKQNVSDARLSFWKWVLQGFMWHNWKYMHMRTWWFCIMLITGLYIPSGPLFYGPIIQNRWGVAYMWGIHVYGETLHTFGALIYAFPIILLVYIPAVMLCASHNDMLRLKMKIHFANVVKTEGKIILTDDEEYDIQPRRRRWTQAITEAFSDRFHFFTLHKGATILATIIILGGGFISYSHLKYYGADSWFAAPAVSYLWIIALVRICSEFTTSYNYFTKCRGKETRRWLIV